MEKVKSIIVKIKGIENNEYINISELSDYVESWFNSKRIMFSDLTTTEENKKDAVHLNQANHSHQDLNDTSTESKQSHHATPKVSDAPTELRDSPDDTNHLNSANQSHNETRNYGESPETEEVGSCDTNPLKEEKTHCYKMGYDSIVNGANQKNCNFSLFSTEEDKNEWEKGRNDAQRDLNREEKEHV